MATLSSRIHDLTAAIVSALNARASQAPASGYDIAKVNGYTGTQAQWLADFSDPGNTDYAAQFNSLVSATPTSTTIASETQAGITQLATSAETIAGTVATKGVSPKNLAARVIATSLADLNSKATTSPAGTVVALTQQDWSNVPSGTNNGYLYNSVWMVDSAQRITPIRHLIATQLSTLTYLASLVGTGKTYTSIFLDPYNTIGLVGSAPTRSEYIYAGATTGFYLWRGLYTAWGYQNGVTDRGGGSTTFYVDGPQVVFNIVGHTNSTAIAQYGAIIGAPQDVIKPINGDVFFTGAKVLNGAWTTITFYASVSDTSFRPLTAGVEANNDFEFSGVYRRLTPTA